MPYFPQDLFERAQAKGDLQEHAYLKAKEECRRMSRSDGIDKVLEAHALDDLQSQSKRRTLRDGVFPLKLVPTDERSE